MKKVLLATLVCSLALTACDKKENSEPSTTQQSTTQSAPNSSPQTTQHEHADHDKHDEHTHDDHDHNHDGHDHVGHDHSHDQGDAYQCADKTVYIAVHNHDGETFAHLTSDNITYDLNEDIQTKGRFTTDDSIAGEDKGMALVIDGNKAKITTLDDKVLLDCTKK